MLIHLMQHGACLPKEADPAQPISPVGIDQITRSAKAMRSLGLEFDLIVASTKLRAVQTAEIIADTIGYPTRKIDTNDAFKPSAQPEKALSYIEECDRELILVVGHLPSLPRLASRLLGHNDGVHLHFSNGGLTSIEASPTLSQATLLWHLQPKHLSLMSG